MVVKVDGGALVMRGTASFIFEASWSTSRGKLVLGRGESELFISKFSATKNGQTYTVHAVRGVTQSAHIGLTLDLACTLAAPPRSSIRRVRRADGARASGGVQPASRLPASSSTCAWAGSIGSRCSLPTVSCSTYAARSSRSIDRVVSRTPSNGRSQIPTIRRRWSRSRFANGTELVLERAVRDEARLELHRGGWTDGFVRLERHRGTSDVDPDARR